MGGRGGGSGESRRAVRRVTEQLLRLALDPPEASARADDDDGAADDGVDVDDGGTRGLGPDALVDVAPERAASALLRALETEKYADVRAAVVAALPRVRHPARFALACVERLAARRDDVSETIGTSPGSSSAPVVQLLLESLGQACAVTAPRPAFTALDVAATRVEDPVARAAAARILARVLRDALLDFGRDDLRDDDAARAPSLRLEPRAVARLAAVVGVDLDDLDAADRTHSAPSTTSSAPFPFSRYALRAYAGACLGSGVATRVSAAASLARHFSLDIFATPTALDTFDDVGHGALADAIAACLSRERRDAYLRRCSRRRDPFWKSDAGAGSGGLTRAERAARAMRRMGLAADLPEESKWREETRLRRLCADGRWDVAERLAGEDASHRALVRRLRDDAVFGGRVDASTHDSTFGTNVTDGSARAIGRHLALDLPADAVRFVDDERGLARVSSALRRERVVGVDTEWRPETCRGDAHRTALMQLAGTRTVAVLDVPKLAERCPDAFATTIREVLCETRTDDAPPVCVGFGVEDDLRRAARSYPGPVADAIASIPATVCLQTMAGRDARFAGTRAGATLSLSAATERVLGAPLDKRETTGDWERRPLTPAQMTYAALDARVLVRLFPAIAGGEGAEDANRDLARAEDANRDRARAEDANRDRAGAYGEDEDAILRRAARAAMAFATPASAFLTADDRDAPAAFAAPSDVDGSLSRSTRRSGVASLAPLPASRVADALRERLPSAGGDPTVILLPPDTGPSAADTAAALGSRVAPEAVVKSIGVVVVGGGSLRTLRTNGARTLADALGASGTDAKQARAASFAAQSSAANAKDAPAMVLLRGTDRCDLRAVAAHFGVSRRRVRLATPAECVDVFGYPPGSMPPFGLRRECATVMDVAVRAYADGDVFPGAGAPNLTFRCLPAVLERAAAATTAPVAESTVAAIRVAASAAKAVETRRGDAASSTVDWGLEARTPGVEGTRDADGDEDEVGSGLGTNLKFVTDGSLGRLARWLRALGVDAEHVPAGAAGRHDALLALAARDDRVILTRDRRLMARREAAGAYLVDELDPKRQLAVVSSHFGLRFRRGRLLTRCAKCNGEVETRLTPEEVATHPNIPEKVKRSTNEFWSCGRCRKVYWVGPKSHKAVKFIQSDIISVLAGSGEDPEAAEAQAIVQEALGGNPWPRGDEGEDGEE